MASTAAIASAIQAGVHSISNAAMAYFAKEGVAQIPIILAAVGALIVVLIGAVSSLIHKVAIIGIPLGLMVWVHVTEGTEAEPLVLTASGIVFCSWCMYMMLEEHFSRVSETRNRSHNQRVEVAKSSVRYNRQTLSNTHSTQRWWSVVSWLSTVAVGGSTAGTAVAVAVSGPVGWVAVGCVAAVCFTAGAIHSRMEARRVSNQAERDCNRLGRSETRLNRLADEQARDAMTRPVTFISIALGFVWGAMMVLLGSLAWYQACQLYGNNPDLGVAI